MRRAAARAEGGGWVNRWDGRRPDTVPALMQGFFIVGDVFLKGVVDLYGDPVPASRGKRGRPPHLPTAENRRFVQLCLVFDKSDAEIAAGLGITERTLHRHYFHELAGRAAARLKLEMKVMGAMVEQATAGKPAAAAFVDRKIEKEKLAQLASHVADRGHRREAAPSSGGLGKKAAAKEAAAQVGGKFAPPPAPRLIN